MPHIPRETIGHSHLPLCLYLQALPEEVQRSHDASTLQQGMWENVSSYIQAEHGCNIINGAWEFDASSTCGSGIYHISNIYWSWRAPVKMAPFNFPSQETYYFWGTDLVGKEQPKVLWGHQHWSGAFRKSSRLQSTQEDFGNCSTDRRHWSCWSRGW